MSHISWSQLTQSTIVTSFTQLDAVIDLFAASNVNGILHCAWARAYIETVESERLYSISQARYGATIVRIQGYHENK